MPSHIGLEIYGSEVLFLPKFSNDPVSKQGKFQGPLGNSYPGGPNAAETILKSTNWLATNFLLASLNKGDPQAYGPLNLVWNPLSLPSTFLPTRGILPSERPTVGNVIATYKENLATSVATDTERLTFMRQGFYSEVAPIKRLQQLRSPIQPPGFRGDLNGASPLSPSGDTLDAEMPRDPLNVVNTIDGQTGGPGETLAKLSNIHTNLYTQQRPYGLENAAFPLQEFEADFKLKSNSPLFEVGKDDIKVSALFNAKPFPGAGLGSRGQNLTFVAKPLFQYLDKAGISLRDIPNNYDVGFDTIDEDAGIRKSTIGDDENYMPFMFQDLRDRTDTFLYFRAFLKEGFSELFSAKWNEEEYYGRTEAVPTYMGTQRTINIAFDLVAWGPKDLPVMYKKLQKLQSMVYPLYDEKGFMKSGPIIRMRVGDLIASQNKKGLAGYINSIDLSYDKTIWNIETDFKVPRKIQISLQFTVLHDTNPGLYPDASDGGEYKFATAMVERNGNNFTIKDISQANIRAIFGKVTEGK